MVAARPAAGGDSGWYFSPAEISVAYRYQENHGRRLRHPLKPFGCYTGQSEFTAPFNGKEFAAPCRFVIDTTRQLKLLLEQGAAKYLFPLDADHGDLMVPRVLWAKRYSQLGGEELLAQVLREPKLVVLYHTAEHLAVSQTKKGEEPQTIREWRAKRNVLGYIDGGSMNILPTGWESSARKEPDGYVKAGTVHFLAHRLGEIAISVNGRGIAFDLSFDDDLAAAP
jgi:hypothetical protein